MLDGYPFPVYSIPTMKMTSDSAIKTQINTIAAQLKWLKSQEANASRNNLPQYVKFFQSDRIQLTQTFNALIGHANSTVGIKYGERRSRTAYLNEIKNRMADRTNLSYVYSANGTLA